MESHIVEPGNYDGTSSSVVYVKSYSVKRFAELYDIPRNFGLLSIDAEGTGSTVSTLYSAVPFNFGQGPFPKLAGKSPVITWSLI